MWAESDKLPSNFAPKTKEEKELINKIDRLVKSKGFEATVDGANSFMSKFIDAILSANVKVHVKQEKTEEYLKIRPAATRDNLDIRYNGVRY